MRASIAAADRFKARARSGGEAPCLQKLGKQAIIGTVIPAAGADLSCSDAATIEWVFEDRIIIHRSRRARRARWSRASSANGHAARSHDDGEVLRSAASHRVVAAKKSGGLSPATSYAMSSSSARSRSSQSPPRSGMAKHVQAKIRRRTPPKKGDQRRHRMAGGCRAAARPKGRGFMPRSFLSGGSQSRDRARQARESDAEDSASKAGRDRPDRADAALVPSMRRTQRPPMKSTTSDAPMGNTDARESVSLSAKDRAAMLLRI